MSKKRSDAFLAARSYWEKKLKLDKLEPKDIEVHEDIQDVLPDKQIGEHEEGERNVIHKAQIDTAKQHHVTKLDATVKLNPTVIVVEAGEVELTGSEELPILIPEDDDKPTLEVLLNSNRATSSPIRLLYNPSYEESLQSKVNKDTIKISQLLGQANLCKSFQFNFSIDLSFLLTFFHPNVIKNKVPITLITGDLMLEDLDSDMKLFNLSQIIANIPNRFGTHHTKMMINYFDDKKFVEVVIMTCNFTKLDLGGLTQMMWKSGKLSTGVTNSTSGKRFQTDLINYLKTYKKGKLDKLAQDLLAYDFLPVKVELLASSPGKYDLSKLTDDSEIYGYGKLYQILRRNSLLVGDTREKSTPTNVLAQVTSISYPFALKNRDTSSIFTHILCPLIFSGSKPFKLLEPGASSSKKHQSANNYCPQIIYPTVKEIASSNVGFGAGQAIHFNYSTTHNHTNQYNQNIKPYLRKWNSSPENNIITGRELVPPHVKLFACDNGDNWSSFKWVLMGSHNLSKQAWGSAKGSRFLTDNPDIYEVSSYELGVVIIPESDTKLVPSYGTDEIDDANVIPIRFPVKLPPKKYSKDDQPWSMHLNYGESIKDKFGNTYNPN